MKRHDYIRVKEAARQLNKDDGDLITGEVVDEVYKVHDVCEKEGGKTLATIYPKVVPENGVECEPKININVNKLVVVDGNVPHQIKKMAERIAKLDGRKPHLEDYYAHAEFLLNHQEHFKLLGQIKLLLEHDEFHTQYRYSFMDFFRMVVGQVPDGLKENYENS